MLVGTQRAVLRCQTVAVVLKTAYVGFRTVGRELKDAGLVQSASQTTSVVACGKARQYTEMLE